VQSQRRYEWLFELGGESCHIRWAVEDAGLGCEVVGYAGER
jgi:hypothetical protein